MLVHVGNIKEVTERIQQIKLGLNSPLKGKPNVKSTGGVRPVTLRIIQLKKRIMVAAAINRRAMSGVTPLPERSKAILSARQKMMNEALDMLEHEREIAYRNGEN